MALTDSIKTADNYDTNGNLEQSNNSIIFLEKSSVLPNSFLVQREKLISVFDNSVLCLNTNVFGLDNLEMRNLPTFRNISQEENNNNLPGKCDKIFPKQMVKYLKSNLDSEHYHSAEWIAGNPRDMCFGDESLLFTENDWRIQCCDVNENKNVTLNRQEFDFNDMEKKDKVSSRRDSEDDNHKTTKRPRTDQGSSQSLVQTTEASRPLQRTRTTTSQDARESFETTYSGPVSFTTELSTTEHLILDEPASSRPEQDTGVTTLAEATTSDVIRVTKSMKSCNIVETKQASTESPSSSTGPLSISAQIDSSVSLTTRSQPIQPDLELPPVTCDLYLDSLLDHECSMYSSRLTSVVHELPSDRGVTNPVSVLLQHGDNMHFIPIEEDSSLSDVQEDD